MSKAEMLRQSAEAKIETRLDGLTSRIQTLRDARLQSAEELSALLEPLAQAMASLSEDAGKTLMEIDSRAWETSAAFTRQLDQATTRLKEATTQANAAAAELSRASKRLDWSHYGLSVMTGFLSAVLVSVFWLWHSPPTVQAAAVDVKALAAELKPSLAPAQAPAQKPSRGK